MVDPVNPRDLVGGQQRRATSTPDERVHQLAPMRLALCTKILLTLGSGPKTERGWRTFREYLVRRYDWERALKLADETNNRYLNKARGLITFNGLTLATIGALSRLEGAAAQFQKFCLVACIIGAVLSAAILLIFLFLVNFGGGIEDYRSDKEEFEAYFLQIMRRTKWISIAGFLSLFSLVMLGMASYQWIYAPAVVEQKVVPAKGH
jgi:hypothetical protein